MASSAFLAVPIWDLVGLTGATLYVGAYILSALDTLPSQSWQYYGLKLVAALLVLGSLLGGDFNLASTVIQVFFVAVSILGLGLRWGRKQRLRACARSRAALHLDVMHLDAISDPFPSDRFPSDPFPADRLPPDRFAKEYPRESDAWGGPRQS